MQKQASPVAIVIAIIVLIIIVVGIWYFAYGKRPSAPEQLPMPSPPPGNIVPPPSQVGPGGVPGTVTTPP